MGLPVRRPVADRPRAVHGRPDDRLVRHVADRLQPRQARGDEVHRHRQLHPDDDRPDDRAVVHRHVQVRADRDPGHDVREPRVRDAAEPPQAGLQGAAPGAGLHADHDPARRLDAGLDRLPEHRDRVAQRHPRRGRPAPARLDQQRDLDLPGADADRAVGDRQLHDHQHRGPPVGAHRAVRGREDGRRRRLDAVPADHDPADVAGPALQPRDHHDRHVPVLHAGLRDHERSRRPEQRDAVRQPRAVPRGVRVQPHGLRRGDRLAAVRGRAGAHAGRCSRSPAAASTTPGASDDRGRQAAHPVASRTAVPSPSSTASSWAGPRS